MVTGFTKFKEKFQGFEEQYVVIGGTACDLLMENEDMTFRATKDVDIVLIVEAVTTEFGKAFWEYIKEAEYEHRNKSTGDAQFYRLLREVCLIPFKAKAWLDLTERKANGEAVDNKNIKKHKNDVFRLAQLITAEYRQVLTEEIAADMKSFLDEMERKSIDLKALGIRGFNQNDIINLLRNCYGIK